MILNLQSNTTSPSNVFFIHSTKQISTGYYPFFYYQGSFKRSSSESCVSCNTSADSLLLCSIAYELASPRPLQKLHSQIPPMAPYRLSFREFFTDSLILTHRGLPQSAIVDSKHLMVHWGPDLILAFPSNHDMLSFIFNLKSVDIVELPEPSSTETTKAADVSSMVAPDAATLPWRDHKRAITPPSLNIKCGGFDDAENDADGCCCDEDSIYTPRASIKVTPEFSTDSKYAGSVPSTPHYRRLPSSS